jgi:hypothetical protein
MIFGGRSAQLMTRQRKRERREVYATEPATPSFLDWSEEAITFDRDDHPDYISNPGHYPLIVNPIIGNARLTKVLMDRTVASTSCTPRLSTSRGSVGLGYEPTQRHSTVSC